MKPRIVIAATVFAFTAGALSQSALADRKTDHTLIGAGIGALAGALLSNGDPMAALAGAAAGGVVGNVTTENDRRHDRGRNQYRQQRGNNDRRDDRRPDRGGDRGDQGQWRGQGR